jgi:hypothetical protein
VHSLYKDTIYHKVIQKKTRLSAGFLIETKSPGTTPGVETKQKPGFTREFFMR